MLCLQSIRKSALRTGSQEVAGSNPVSSTIFFTLISLGIEEIREISLKFKVLRAKNIGTSPSTEENAIKILKKNKKLFYSAIFWQRI
jgi:hypothetical protein